MVRGSWDEGGDDMFTLVKYSYSICVWKINVDLHIFSKMLDDVISIAENVGIGLSFIL